MSTDETNPFLYISVIIIVITENENPLQRIWQMMENISNIKHTFL